MYEKLVLFIFNEVPEDHHFCKLFPCTLAGEATHWFKKLPLRSLTTLNDMRDAILNKFLYDSAENLKIEMESIRRYMVEGDEQHVSGELSRVEEADISGMTSMSTDGTTSTLPDGRTSMSTDGMTSTSLDGTTSTSTDGTTSTSPDGTTSTCTDVTTQTTTNGMTSTENDATTLTSIDGTTSTSTNNTTSTSIDSTNS